MVATGPGRLTRYSSSRPGNRSSPGELVISCELRLSAFASSCPAAALPSYTDLSTILPAAAPSAVFFPLLFSRESTPKTHFALAERKLSSENGTFEIIGKFNALSRDYGGARGSPGRTLPSSLCPPSTLFYLISLIPLLSSREASQQRTLIVHSLRSCHSILIHRLSLLVTPQ